MANYKVIRGIEDFNAARARHKARVDKYLRDPHPWATEHEAILAGLRADRERDETKARAMIADGVAELEQAAEVHHPKAGAAEVAAAWSRIEKQLNAGRRVDEIVGRSSFNRVEAQALVENFEGYLTTKLVDSDPVEIERVVKPALRAVETAEMRLMPEHERAGVEAARELQVLREEVEPEVSRLLIAEQTGGVKPEDLIRFGYAVAAIPGYEPPAPAFDAAQQAEKERNSLPPELRDALDRNAQQVGYRSNESGFGSGAEGGS